VRCVDVREEEADGGSWGNRLPPSLLRELGGVDTRAGGARCSLSEREEEPDSRGLWKDADGEYCDGCAGRAPRGT
jgi:hypothetical protein